MKMYINIQIDIIQYIKFFLNKENVKRSLLY